MTSQIAPPVISDDTVSQEQVLLEQLHLPFQDGEKGILPLRLLEPISSLHLTPFAAKAVRGIGATTVGEVATFIFDASKDYRGLGQGHIEEIRRKVEQFVGKPPYQKEQHIDISSLLRLALADIEPTERAAIVTRYQLQQIVTLSSQERREAEVMLAIDKERKFAKIIEKARLKSSENILSLLNTIFCGFIKPWMQHRFGIASEQEICLFLFESQAPLLPLPENSTIYSSARQEQGIGIKKEFVDYKLFDRSLGLLKLLSSNTMLFSPFLYPVAERLWAVSEQDQARACAILQDAHMLIGKKKEKESLYALAKAVEECRFGQWDGCACAAIERLLFWHYLPT
jgi:hypothetical protein